jgi:hypothetical protein
LKDEFLIKKLESNQQIKEIFSVIVKQYASQYVRIQDVSQHDKSVPSFQWRATTTNFKSAKKSKSPPINKRI